MESCLDHICRPKGIAGLSKSFITMMEKGNMNGTLKQLKNNVSNGILLSDDIT